LRRAARAAARSGCAVVIDPRGTLAVRRGVALLVAGLLLAGLASV
jgi:hypothetical protein